MARAECPSVVAGAQGIRVRRISRILSVRRRGDHLSGVGVATDL